MSLAKLCARVATHDELATLLEELEKENTRFRLAILWALGEHEEFPVQPDGGKPYWFRTELRQRAGLDV